MCGNNGTKGKISKIIRALDSIRDLNRFTGGIRKPISLQVSNKNKLERIEVTVAADSSSDDPVLMEKYKEMVVMRSLNET